ncbi:MAG: beta strand repeat-containing protein, partial [Lysobacter sp.]
MQVDQATIDTLVENRHLIQADAGTVILSAQSAHGLLGRVVNSGAIEANGITTDGGTVRLVASSAIEHSGSIQADAGANGNGGDVVVIADLSNPDSRTTVSGTLSARGGSEAGDGGFIETSGTHLKIEDSARIDTSAPNGQTGQWLLDPYDFTIAASGGDITGAALGSALASNDVTIQTTDSAVSCTNATCNAGDSAGNGDIFVNDTVSWASASTLTLDAWRNIEVSQAISVTGTGGLTLKYGQQAVNSGNTAAYLLSAPINLASGATFQTQLGNDVGLTSYTIVNNRAALDTVTSGSDYVLGANFAAGATAFTPISSFTNVFDGLGHTIDGLTIDTAVSNNSGLFAEVGGFMMSGGEVRNLGLTNVSVTGTASWLGGIAGTNFGSIHHSYVTGNVGSADGAGTLQTLGGLVGSNNGSIASSYSGATVTGANGDNDAVVGGLVGVNTATSGSGGTIADSYATGTVGKVSGATTGAIGGLVGSNEAGGAISNSYASASVSAGTSTRQGGLVGMNGNNDSGTGSTVSNSYYNSTLYSGNGIGDDVAAVPQTVTAKTTAQLTAATVLADLGLSSVTWLRDSTTGYPVLRGIVYSASGAPTVIYIRLIPGSSTYGDAVSLSYGLFSAATAGTSITDASPSGTVTWSGTLPTDTSNVGNYSLTYNGGITLGNAGYSLVAGNAVTWTVNPRPITVTATSGQSKAYNGLGGADPTLAYTVSAGTLVNSDTLSGALARAAGSNVGSYAIDQGTLANGNYDIAFVADTFAITPKALTVTGTTAADKTYDGSATAAITAGTLSGFVGTETVTATATGTFDSKDAGPRTATATYTLADGSNGGLADNYSLADTSGHAATITPKALTVTGTTAAGKTYDGSATAAITAGTLSGFVGTETVTATATGTFDSKEAGPRTATATYTLADGSNGGLADNYSLADTSGHAATI